MKSQPKLVWAISSEIFSQMSRKLEEMKFDLNSHILEVINSAIDEKILPSIENVIANNFERGDQKYKMGPSVRWTASR